MTILKQSEVNDFSQIIDILNNGGLIIFPTETSYGVGVDATNPAAVSRLLEYKARPEGKAISIAVDSKDSAKKYVELNDSANKLYDTFLPGPVTIISKSKNVVDKRLESENGNLGIRIPNYKFMLDLLKEFGKPITSTSANYSGKKTPYSINDILEYLPPKNTELIDLIIDAGELPKNPPSTVIDTTTNELTTYRQGRIDPNKVGNFKTLTSDSVEKTITLGEEFIKENIEIVKTRPLIILLNGELGAGKTHFTKGVAKALGIKNIIKSPTYNYFNEYEVEQAVLSSSNSDDASFKPKLFHFDAWRVQSRDDLDMLRFYDWFKPGNIIVIEWPSVVMNLDPEFFENKEIISIEIIHVSDSAREFKVYEIG